MEIANKEKKYIDLFSGCGGFSLGLGTSGWKGIFAIEKDPMAFDTFKHNLINGQHGHFLWPEWLPQEAMTVQHLLKKYKKNLINLKGTIDLIAGGPPCQGFSLAGQRNPDDPRNKLSKQYIQVVSLVQPKFVVLENVKGFNLSFKGAKGEKKIPYAMIVKSELEKLGYTVFFDHISSEKFGVPQKRTRFIMIGIKNNELLKTRIDSPFITFENLRINFLKERGLPIEGVSTKDAIHDLSQLSNDNKLTHHSGSINKGFKKVKYEPPKSLNPYLKIMRHGFKEQEPNSMRLARHKKETISQFKKIQKISSPGVSLNADMKKKLGIKKQSICVLDPNKPSKTLTTLPDDLIHYCEPRILTVRESARIQSFPDSFVFKGKYTTGGDRRTKECPRYTQVGNAVPPLMAEAIGALLTTLLKSNYLQGSKL